MKVGLANEEERQRDLSNLTQKLKEILAPMQPAPREFNESADYLNYFKKHILPVQAAIRRGTFEKDLQRVRNMMGWRSQIEIKGCNIGGNGSFLNKIQEFFGGNFLPRISAPDWYQFFFSPDFLTIPDSDEWTEKAWVSDSLLVRDSFESWWRIINTSLPPPSLEDFRAFLREGKAFPGKVRADDKMPRLISIKRFTPSSFVNWLMDNKYHLQTEKEILRQFFRGTLTQAFQKLWLDVLMDDPDSPTETLLSADPRYDSHIIKVPGKINVPQRPLSSIPGERGDFELKKEKTGNA